MLDAFEARLTDLLADLLAGVVDVHLVARPRGDLGSNPPAADRAILIAQVLNAAPDLRFGDDARERRGPRGEYRLQTVLHLAGQAVIDFRVAPGSATPDVPARRNLLVRVVDRVLVAFHNDEVRSGRAFRTDVDLGFELDGFRLVRVEGPPDNAEGFTGVRALYDYAGRFWPVEVPVEGEMITTLPTRIAVLPVQIPDRIRARAGGPDLEILLRLDLRALSGAPALLVARLSGASPPGQLVGSAPGAPVGWTGFVPASDGLTRVIYRPPATVAGNTRVHVSTALAADSGPTVAIGDFVIELTA